jgi:hypothetical protein
VIGLADIDDEPRMKEAMVFRLLNHYRLLIDSMGMHVTLRLELGKLPHHTSIICNSAAIDRAAGRGQRSIIIGEAT